MVGTFREPSRGRRLKPIHSILYSVAQPLERGSNNYYSIIQGVTKADREARKSDDLLKRNFTSEKPLEKCVTGITEIKAKDGKLYVSAIFACFDSAVLGLAMETTMKATLCQHTVENAFYRIS